MLEAKQPEYMSWDLERLRKEYFSLNLKYHAERVADHDRQEKEEKVERFLDAFKELVESSRGDKS